jgi:hypothetical protein
VRVSRILAQALGQLGHLLRQRRHLLEQRTDPQLEPLAARPLDLAVRTCRNQRSLQLGDAALRVHRPT